MPNKYLTELCHKCNGEGKIPAPYVNEYLLKGDKIVCWCCRGFGHLPSEEGRMILELIENFGRK